MQTNKPQTTVIVTFATALAILAACAFTSVPAEKKPYISPLKEVMGKGFKGDDSIRSKIIDGTVEDADWDQFIAYVKTMQEFKPRKGDIDSWNEKTANLLNASKAARADAGKLIAFEEVSKCKGCHTPHKIYPPKKKTTTTPSK